ncbi:MAG: ABC transporter permease [Bryobacteraceae bacterium]
MTLWNDVRYGARMLWKAPGFSLTAIVTLALGIGATTAVYSSADALLWKPIPLPHLETMVILGQRVDDPNEFDFATPADIEDVRRQSGTLESMASWEYNLANIVSTGGEPERAEQALVNANFFEVMQVQPALGRAFQAGEDQPGREREVIFSDALWRNRFAGDPNLLGKTIRLDDQNYTVVGVMPPKFAFPLGTDLWTPIALTPAQRTSRISQLLVTVARLKPGRTVQQAQAEMEGIAARLNQAYPDTNRNRHFAVWPARRFIVDRETNEYLVMMLVSVCFVLLIACVNVANLQFARATGRLREVAVRTALGAGRGRIVTQLVTESVLLALAGAALGLLVANWGIGLIRAGMPPEIERYIVGWKDIRLDGRALGFTLAAALASGILVGLAPAWQNSRPNLTDALKEGGRGGSGTRAHYRLRSILVAAEMALAVVLLVGAGLMMRGFHNLMISGENLEPNSLLTMRLGLPDTKYHEPHQMAAFYQEALRRIEAIPGVRSAVAVTSLPYSDHSSNRLFTIEGRPVEPGNAPVGMYQLTSSKYFDTLHVALRSGRLLTEADGPDAPRVAVINQSLADRWWKNESPVGHRVKIGKADSKEAWLTIVGVVSDVVHNPYSREPRRMMFLPYQQAPGLWMDVGVRTAGDPLQLAPAVTAAIRSIDPELPISNMQTLEKSLHDSAIGLNYVEVFMGIFGMLALVLASVGVYGVMSYMVSEQTRDIGIRMALGAPRGGVLRMLFLRGVITAISGMAVGIPLAYLLARYAQDLIYGITASDPATFAGIPLALLGAMALAIYIPARRAMGIDPMVALRYE